MSLTRVLQPYVCCLGNPVAGNPTQFVMYRAARATGVDWRFFTSQVAVDQFEVAFRGVQALGLDGVALFEPFQTRAIPLLESVTETALCLERVNVARSDGNSWLGDNTLGASICSCIETHQTKHGAGSIVVIGDPKIGKVIQLAASHRFEHLLPLQLATSATSQSPAGEPSDQSLPNVDPLTSQENTAALPAPETLEQFLEQDGRTSFLVLTDRPTSAELKTLASMAWQADGGCIVLGNSNDKQLRPIKEWLSKNHVRFIEPVELMAHQAAADFHFWTGVWPSTDQMRDSLEEYLQW